MPSEQPQHNVENTGPLFQHNPPSMHAVDDVHKEDIHCVASGLHVSGVKYRRGDPNRGSIVGDYGLVLLLCGGYFNPFYGDVYIHVHKLAVGDASSFS